MHCKERVWQRLWRPCTTLIVPYSRKGPAWRQGEWCSAPLRPRTWASSLTPPPHTSFLRAFVPSSCLRCSLYPHLRCPFSMGSPPGVLMWHPLCSLHPTNSVVITHKMPRAPDSNTSLCPLFPSARLVEQYASLTTKCHCSALRLTGRIITKFYFIFTLLFIYFCIVLLISLFFECISQPLPKRIANSWQTFF